MSNGQDQDQDALAAEWAAQLDADMNEDAEAEPAGGGAKESDDDLASRWADALASEEEESTQAGWDKATLRAQASDARFKDMTDIARQPRADNAKRELDFILDIPLDVSAELGRTRLLINELLQLGQGSVVELNKLAGEPLKCTSTASWWPAARRWSSMKNSACA